MVGGARPPDPSASFAGRTIARYALEALIGRGGMGEVYRADDPRLRRKVALKIIRPDRVDRMRSTGSSVKHVRPPR